MVISPLGATPEFRTVAALADHIGEEYACGMLDRVDLIYTEFGGRVTTQQLLPIQPPVGEDVIADVIFEPDPAVILERLLPAYLRTMLFHRRALRGGAEHSARVAAMSLATEKPTNSSAHLPWSTINHARRPSPASGRPGRRRGALT